MLDEKGFKRKRFDDLFAEMEDKAKEVYGDQINTSALSPVGILLRIFAWFLAMKWAVAERVYYSAYVNTADGVSLDRIGPYVGISRILSQYATGTVTLTGTPGYVVPAGFLVSTETDIQFETLSDATIAEDGTVSATVEAVEAGLSGNVGAGLITVVVNPIPDVTSVHNAADTGGGRDKETDPEFRDRFELSVAGGGSATVDAIRGALLRVSGVRAAVVIENNTMQVDAAGRPPKSFEAFVLGGQSADIASAIFGTKAAGIESYGSESVVVKDLAGNSHTVHYSPAVQVPVHVKLDVYKSAAFPANGVELIKTALVRFVGGADADGTVYAGLTMGADVVHMRMAAVMYGIQGVEDIALQLSKDGSTWQESNIVIDVQQVAQAAADRIEVTLHDFTD